MPPDDDLFPSRYKYSTSGIAGVFKSLSASRTKSNSAASLSDSSDSLYQYADGHTSYWKPSGFDSMHRGSVVSSSSDASGGRDFETSVKLLAQKQNLSHACDEAEQVARAPQCYTPEQALELWEAGSHLMHHEGSFEVRRSGSLLLMCISARQDLSPAARRTVFDSILSESESDVIPARAQALVSLSDHGRRLEFATSSLLPLISSFLLPVYEIIAAARTKARKAKVGKANGLAYEDTVLDDLLQFAVDLITLQRKQPESDEVRELLDQIFIICKKTSVVADIKHSLAVFDAVILYGDVPDGSFVPMLEVLCSIHASVKPLSGPTSRAVRNLAKSKRKSEMVDSLHSFLRDPTGHYGQHLNILRGAVYAFADLIRAHGQEGIAQLQFEPLMASLKIVVQKNDGRLEADILELCLNTLEGDFAQVSLTQNWTGFVSVLNSCSKRVVEEPETSAAPLSPDSPQSRGSTIDDVKPNILANIVQIASAVGSLWDSLNGQQRLEITNFLSNVCQHIEPSQAELILNTMRTEKLCDPQTSGWVQCCQQVINYFVRDRSKPAEVRITALETLKEAFSTYESLVLFHTERLLDLMLETFSDEDSILFLESLVSFLVNDIVPSCDDTALKSLIDIISSPMTKDLKDLNGEEQDSIQVSSPEGRSSIFTLEASLANVCAVGLVRMFLRSLNLSAAKAITVYEALLRIAESSDRPLDSRLTALKMLFRLRCDSSGSVIVISVPEDNFRMSISGRNLDSNSLTNDLEDSAGDHIAENESSLSLPQRRLPTRAASTSALSRSTGRSTSHTQRVPKLSHPVWAYTAPQVLPEEPPVGSSPFLYAHATPNTSPRIDSEPAQRIALKANVWLETIIILLQRETNWDIYSYVLTHLAPQLQNKDLFDNAVPQIKLLRSILCDQIKNDSFREPPVNTGVKKSDVAGYIFDSLCVLISYHEHFAKSEEDELVRSFMMGIIGSWGGTSRGCIHALSVCCHEIPLSVTKALNGILDKISKLITLSNLAVHILEFLALLARLPEVYINLREEEIRTVFGICIRLLQTSREHRQKVAESPNRILQGATRTGSVVREAAALPGSELSEPSAQDAMSTYIYTSTHHVMIFWFLSLKLQDRAKHVNWITSRLIFADEHGKETLEEQSQVFLDLMQRVAFSDLGETIPFTTFPPSPEDGPVVKKSWIVGMSIVTVETASVSGLSQITKRQASGTTYAMYQQRTAPVLPHQIPVTHDAHLHSDNMRTDVLPSHIMLQLTATAFPTPTTIQPIPLPDDDMTRRALSTFDRNDIVDGHKIGVIYIDDGQATEAEILSNTVGSPDYEYFLSGLGTKVSLKDARFNTQGLHAETDGEFAYAWRDRVTEIVYHVTTMMPTNFDTDPSCILKKSHIGNDFVNIIFNHSNTPFNFNTIPSQFNFFNIVISPVSRLTESDKVETAGALNPENMFYCVKVMSKPGFPEISPAASPKIISGKNLAPFVRILALNASVFSLVWNSQGEHISSWRNRLREIKRLRERVMGSQSQTPDTLDATYPTQRRNTKANIFSEEVPVRTSSGRSELSTDWNATADSNILLNLDFARWAR
ncbi:putative GTPase activating protein (Tsc2) [Aspergillus mulundensis]|uniref:Tuberin n=1 Tax=Aspergillus mulundensis TaxID=1810919 RepID=A0A3D8SC10_9EURO|nr:Tuberin [Aspergillus mulundensis]RDW83889.1 Tuberin [Aspergillus mulundensis]